LALQPSLAEAWHGRGNVLCDLCRYDEALAAYDKATALQRDFAKAWHGRGDALNHLDRHAEAAKSYTRALAIEPRFEFAKGLRLHEKMLCCDWDGLERLVAEIESDIEAGKFSAEPFGWLALSHSEKSLQKCAELYAQKRFPAQPVIAQLPRSRGGDKIRVGYLSGEFRAQATSFLLVGVLERHDREKFEVYAIDNGDDDGSETRRRVVDAVHRVVPTKHLTDAEAAARIRENEIDILVNLNGYFGEARMDVFAHRPAPIQVNFLGFPGTLGALYIDYIVADRTVIPASNAAFFTEKVVTLPHCYQPNDRSRPIAADVPSRVSQGLPEQGFVFCCFNNNFKINPRGFGVWMRILAQTEGSVLWLLEDSAAAAANLRREAETRGIAAERLVFAPRRLLADHLARHRCADLFLDTTPYGAHTTASDALWAGLPVLTALGATFASRVAASLLTTIGLPELIAADLDTYADLAVALAADRARLKEIRDKLAANRLTTPLFDSALYARHIEAAYGRMAERLRAGLPPDHFEVPNA
ncbi:MAG TPA: tetratricopeptide repeat protein, partial [Beijerinckiaceae bacterium]|nr:tetratricopeptide repeat protein [Beijerinckiaceae bacterium]